MSTVFRSHAGIADAGLLGGLHSTHSHGVRACPCPRICLWVEIMILFIRVASGSSLGLLSWKWNLHMMLEDVLHV